MRVVRRSSNNIVLVTPPSCENRRRAGYFRRRVRSRAFNDTVNPDSGYPATILNRDSAGKKKYELVRWHSLDGPTGLYVICIHRAVSTTAISGKSGSRGGIHPILRDEPCALHACKAGANDPDDVARARGNRECNRVQPPTTGYDPNWTRSAADRMHDGAYDRPNYSSKPSARSRARVAPTVAILED